MLALGLALVAAASAAIVALPWYARDLVIGLPDGELARVALLVRYEDFFRLTPPTLEAYLAAFPAPLVAKAAALVTNAGTFLAATAIVLGPLAFAGAWRRRREPIPAGWLVAVATLYLLQSLVFTLHGVRGSFAHSFAALLPGAVALGVVTGERAISRAGARRVAAAALAAGVVVLSTYATFVWRDEFDGLLADRRAVASLVMTPALVLDAAAWRDVVDGPTVLMPAEGLEAARDVARRYGAKTLVLEPAHLSAYDALFAGRERVDWLEPLGTEGGVEVWRVVP